MGLNLTKLDEWSLWVPDIDDARRAYADGDDSVVMMELRFLTKAQRDQCQRMLSRMGKNGASSSADESSLRRIFEDNVRNVRNVHEGDRAITTGGDLYDLDGMDAFLAMVFEALFHRASLEEGLAKKLRSPSASSLPVAKSSASGGAVVATHPSLPIMQEEQKRKAI